MHENFVQLTSTIALFAREYVVILFDHHRILVGNEHVNVACVSSNYEPIAKTDHFFLNGMSHVRIFPLRGGAIA